MHWNFKGYWLMDQNIENTDSYAFLQQLHNHGLYWNKTVIFEFLGIFLIRSSENFVQSCFIFWENTQILQ